MSGPHDSVGRRGGEPTAVASGVEPTAHLPRIIMTPGTCGGRPRLDGHRLDMRFWTIMRHAPRSYIAEHWPDITDEQYALVTGVANDVIKAYVAGRRLAHGGSQEPSRR